MTGLFEAPLPLFPRGGWRTENPGSIPKPEAARLWEKISPACEVRECKACGLVFLRGPGQLDHWTYCPENRDARPIPAVAISTESEAKR